MTWTVTFSPSGLIVPAGQDDTLLDAARGFALFPSILQTPCGGNGLCGHCRIRITHGQTTPPTDREQSALGEEEITAGFRLACQTRARSPLRVEVPDESQPPRRELLVDGPGAEVRPEPAVTRYTIPLYAFPEEGPLVLWGQVEAFLTGKAGLHDILIDPAMKTGPSASGNSGAVTVTVRGNRVINAYFSGRVPPPVGLAVDLGTTKIGCYIVDLETGKTLAAGGMVNPQVVYGEDIMSRLSYMLGDSEGGDRLAAMEARAINLWLDATLPGLGLAPESIEDVVIAGNTAMHHILLRAPVDRLARAPFSPSVTGPRDEAARDLGIKASPGALVHFVPPVAGFVGGDHVAMVLATGIHEEKGIVLGLDIGTNTEIVLSVDGQMSACSCPSGPAFEGAHLYQGMAAADGAVFEVRLPEDGKAPMYKTIGDKPALGLCGSGALDAVAGLVRRGIVNDRGALDRSHPGVWEGSTPPFLGFILVPAPETGIGRDIVLTQKDIGQIQLAKGAIASGIEVLLRSAGIDARDIGKVVVAGAFGARLRIESAITVGLLPDLPLERFSQVGNAAGVGARMILVSMTQRRLAEDIARRITYVELASAPGFSQSFARALRFPRVSP